ncbi:hypothetical protein N9164_12585 [Draconibacterium sp.]|nr:hypothetical protein [Draconibacterium sp.]
MWQPANWVASMTRRVNRPPYLARIAASPLRLIPKAHQINRKLCRRNAIASAPPRLDRSQYSIRRQQTIRPANHSPAPLSQSLHGPISPVWLLNQTVCEHMAQMVRLRSSQRFTVAAHLVHCTS